LYLYSESAKELDRTVVETEEIMIIDLNYQHAGLLLKPYCKFAMPLMTMILGEDKQ